MHQTALGLREICDIQEHPINQRSDALLDLFLQGLKVFSELDKVALVFI